MLEPEPSTKVDPVVEHETSNRGTEGHLVPLPKSSVLCALPPGSTPQFSLVFLHGFGETAQVYASTRRQIFTTLRELGLRVVLPTAQRLRITAYGGQRDRAWYDYVTDYDGAAEDELGEETLAATRQRIGAIVDEEADLVGGHDRVLLGGTSQGCCAAFDTFARHKQQLAGFVGVVGHPLSTTLVADSAQRNVPCGFCNGRNDDYMRLEWVSPAVQRLRKAGWSQVWAIVSEGVDHDPSVFIERAWIVQFLAPLLVCSESF